MSGVPFWPAPAKLNLFLHITGRRPDGYHLLQTVFQLLDHGDELSFDVRPDGLIRRLSPLDGVPEETDLTVRAARLLQQHTGCRRGADITLRKRLPLGGGLGGGSSDAATTLAALNCLWGLELPTGELARLGLALGADVPVFVHGRSAWAEGVGESLTPVDLPPRWYLVIAPACHVSTAAVFSAPQLTRNCRCMTIADFLSGAPTQNVCEPVVVGQHAPVAQALAWLNGFAPARMTGTGACVFAAFDTEDAAQAVFTQRPPGWQGFVARGANRSPLLERAAACA